MTAESIRIPIGGTMVPIPGTGTPPPPPEHPVIAALCRVMAKFGSVGKSGTNEGAEAWKYATIEDVLSKAQPLLAEEGLLIIQSEVSTDIWLDSLLAIKYRFALWHKSGFGLVSLSADPQGHPIEQTGLASIINNDNTYDDKAANKCHTAARKYFILSLFQVPTKNIADADKHKSAAVRKEPSQEPEAEMPAKPRPAIAEWCSPIELPEPNEAAGLSVMDWAQRFASHMRAAKTEAEVEGWKLANSVVLEDMKKKALALHERLEGLSEALKNDLKAMKEAA